MSLKTYTAIIIDNRDFRENDQRIIFYSLENGLQDAVAIGVKKITSKQRGRLEQGVVTNLTIAKGRRFDKVTTSDPLWIGVKSRQSFEKLCALQFLMGLVKEISKNGDVNDGQFEMLVSALQVLDVSEEQEQNIKEWCKSVVYKLLEVSGFQPIETTSLKKQLQYFFEKPIRSLQILELIK